MEYADGGDLQVIVLKRSIKSSPERIASPEWDSNKNSSGKLPFNFFRDSKFSTNTI